MGSFFLLFVVHFFRVPISTLWLRIVESDKPVFTLIGGGIGAGVKAIQEIIKVI